MEDWTIYHWTLFISVIIWIHFTIYRFYIWLEKSFEEAAEEYKKEQLDKLDRELAADITIDNYRRALERERQERYITLQKVDRLKNKIEIYQQHIADLYERINK